MNRKGGAIGNSTKSNNKGTKHVLFGINKIEMLILIKHVYNIQNPDIIHNVTTK
jgi:hypothetical protein